MIYFTSDTHFNCERLVLRKRSPFKSVKEMNQTIIDNWNEVVKPNDTVYHLGDFGTYQGNFEFVKKLNGKIILIMGNSEAEFMMNYFDSNFKEFKKYLINLGFYEVHPEEGIEIEFEHSKGNTLFLTHKPINCVKDRYNLFGHLHNHCLLKEFGLNVGTECHNFYPIDREIIKSYQHDHMYFPNFFCRKEDLYTSQQKKEKGNIEDTPFKDLGVKHKLINTH